MSAKRTYQRQALWDLWVALDASIKESIEFRNNEIFANIERAAGVLFERDAARFSRLGVSDEDIYTRLEELMNVYLRVIELAGSIRGGGDRLHVLIGGICEVLNSRLTEFAAVKQGIEAENPVLQEKCLIVARSFSYVNDYIENIGWNFIPWMQDELPEQWAQLCSPDTADITLEEVIAKECLPEIYIHFQKWLRICLLELDDLHSRKTAGVYTELIAREWEELANIIKVQVHALEAATTEDIDPSDESNLPTVHTILDMLRMEYQQTGPIIERFQKMLNSPPAHVTAPTYEEFEAAMVAAINVSEAQKPSADEFFALLDDEAVALFGKLQGELPKTAHMVKRAVNEDRLLAEAVVQEFVKLYRALAAQETPDISEENRLHHDILAGVTETIEIKIESLQESIETFDAEGQKLLHVFTQEKITPSEDDLRLVQDAVKKAWFDFPHDGESLAVFFTTFLQSEVFDGFRARVQKHTTNYRDKTDKFTFRFKKEILLYEICTFEEIFTHSVSRLRECEDMTDVVALLDAAFARLTTLLEKNSITAISPAAHELFNAFEHEVIIAESQEGFAKGEIIKVVNAGYKQNDKVILRANVIAAR